jgi:hypothetical protein
MKSRCLISPSRDRRWEEGEDISTMQEKKISL